MVWRFELEILKLGVPVCGSLKKKTVIYGESSLGFPGICKPPV